MTSVLHHHHEPEHHVVDWGHIARMEKDLFGETYHHDAPGCRCDKCAIMHNEQAYNLRAQIERSVAYQHHEMNTS